MYIKHLLGIMLNIVLVLEIHIDKLIEKFRGGLQKMINNMEGLKTYEERY